MARTAYNTDARESYQSVPLPLVLPYNGMGVGGPNGLIANGPASFMKNSIITTYHNPTTGKADIEVRNRDGIAVSAIYTTLAQDQSNRGIFYWDKTDKVYSVFGNYLLMASPFNSTETSLVPGTFSGGGTYNYGHFTEYFDGTNYYLAVKKTNPTSKAYVVDTAAVVTEIVDADYPNTTAIGQFISLDGYLFVLTNTGRVYNSDLGAPLAWTSTSFLTAAMSPDKGIGLSKYKNQIVAFGTNSIEFFYNAANPTGSPLARTEQAFIDKIGCVDSKTIIEFSDTVYWVAGSIGTLGVYKFENFKPKKISSNFIDQIISQNLERQGSFYAGKINLNGTETYYFSIADRGFGISSLATFTYLYNESLDLWHIWSEETSNDLTFYEWGMVNESLLPSASYTLKGSTLFPAGSSASAAKIFYFSGNGISGAGGDESGEGTSLPIKFELRTRPLDFGTHNFIRIHKLILKILSNNQSIPVNYILTNLGRYRHPYFSIKQTIITGGDLTVSINGGTARTIATAIVSPVIIDAEIQYSVCEH